MLHPLLLEKASSSVGGRRLFETRGGEGCQERDVRNGEGEGARGTNMI